MRNSPGNLWFIRPASCVLALILSALGSFADDGQEASTPLDPEKSQPPRAQTETSGQPLQGYQDKGQPTPAWAAAVRDAYKALLSQIEWWHDNRQREDGSSGGGWAADVETGHDWQLVVLANPKASPKAYRAVKRVSEGVWWSEAIDRERGFFRNVAQVQSAATLTGQTQANMIGVDHGNPVYLERAMKTVILMRDLWTGFTPRGHRHFRSCWLGSSALDLSDLRRIDVPANGLACLPALWLFWYSGDETTSRVVLEWAVAWLDDIQRSDNGKPRGAIPLSIGFDNDELGGNGATDWRASNEGKAESDASKYERHVKQLLHAAYDRTGDMKWLNATSPPLSDPRVFQSVDKSEVVRLAQRCANEWRARAPQPVSRAADAALPLPEGFESVLGYMVGGDIAGGLSSVSTTYEDMPADVAPLVLSAGPDHARIALCSSLPEPREIGLRMWSLKPLVRYQVEAGVDSDGDDVIDGSATRFPYVHQHRGDAVRTTVPGQKTWIVDIKREGEPLRPLPKALPDLAVGPEDITWKDGRLSVTVHNVGSAAAENIRVLVWATGGDPSGQISRERIPRLEAPNDALPRTVSFVYDWKPAAGGGIVVVTVDAEDEIYEITERNNKVERLVPYELPPYMTPSDRASKAPDPGRG